MALGDILWASGFDHKDRTIFDLGGVGNEAYEAPGRTPQSTFSFRPSTTGATYATASLYASGVKEFVVGQGFYTAASNEGQDFFKLTSPNASDNFAIGMDGATHLRVRRGGTTLATGSTVLTVGIFYWVWLYVKIGDSGRYWLTLNNVTEIAAANGDTRADAGTNGDTCDRFGIGGTPGYKHDDVYIIDATGTTNDGVDCSPGEVTIPYLVPNAAGDTTALTPSAGTNWQNVDEIPPSDTDYNGSATPGDLDLYNITDISNAASVKGAVVRGRAYKSDAGPISGRLKVKSGGSPANGPDLSLSTTPSLKSYWPLRKNPVTAADWTLGDISALQVGYEVRT